MKNFKLSLIASLAIGMCTVSNASSLQEALVNGKTSGEFTATYETRDFDKDNGGYYRDSGYAVGSFALKYETATWNNLSLTSKFRAYKTIFEEEDESTTSYGTGDASERFWEKDGSNRSADIEELYLTYKIDNFSVKAGRQFISSHWVNKTNDAVKIDASFGNTSLEAIWAARHGRIYSRDYRPMTKTNENKGVYQVALSHKFSDMLSVTAYDRIEPDVRDIYGAKINGKLGDFSLGAHYAENKEDNSSIEESSLMHFTASTSIAGFSPYVGYIKIDDDAAFPGWTSSGETIDPFEEGDYIYSKGAETFYLGVSKSFGDLSATLLYGMTEYLDANNDKLDMDETTLWLGYPITKDLKANLGYTIVNETDAADHGDYNQLNFTLTYSF